MRLETIPGMGARGKKRMMEGVNSTMMYCKNFGKCTTNATIKKEK
jgi:hypothetical protein